MRIIKKRLIYVLLSLLGQLCLPVQADVRLLAEVGQPAADFPEGFIYWNVEPDVVIGPSGHVAFAGAADVSLGSTESNTNVVWAGLPGQLRAIIRENDTVSGFPANVLFDSTSTSANVGGMVVSTSGAVAFPALMKGAGAGQSQRALLVHADGVTTGVLRVGDPAPGFPAGTFIAPNGLLNFAFSDAGMVISGTTTSGESGIWFFNGDSIIRLPEPIPGCNFLLPFTGFRINQGGEIAVRSFLLTGNGQTQCPPAGIFKWKAGSWETVMTQNAPVPQMNSAQFNLQSILPVPSFSINDSGRIGAPITIQDNPSIGKAGFWQLDTQDTPRLIALAEEFLADDDNAIFRDSLPIFGLSAMTNNGASLVSVVLTNQESVLLAGFPRPEQPYPSLAETGPNQLTVIARTNRRPMGLDDSWFYSGLLSQALNRNADFVYSALASEASSNQTAVGLWRGSVNGQRPRLKAMDGMKVTFDGRERQLTRLFTIGNNRIDTLGGAQNNTSGTPSQLSDTGDTVLSAEVEGSFRSLILIADDTREQRIFALAEQLFPQFFAPASAEDRLFEGFEYRFYPDTQTYIGIKNGEVFLLGGAFGPTVLRFDTVDATLALLEARARGLGG